MALLAGELARLAASGDESGARVLHEAIGKLLAAPVTSMARETAAPPLDAPACVVDLVEERRRRAPR